jgi:hypothetical protein
MTARSPAHACRVLIASLLLSLIACSTQVVAQNCDDAIRRHNATADADAAWFRAALTAKFGVSRWADIDWSEDDACSRILPIYREQLSRAENVLALAQTARRVCRRLTSAGDASGVDTEERIRRIKENIRLCEEVVSGKDDDEDEDSGEEGEEEFNEFARQAEPSGQGQPVTPERQAANPPSRSGSCSDLSGIKGQPLDCPEPKKQQFEQPKQVQKQAAVPKQEAYGPPRPSDDPAVALIDKIISEARKFPGPQLSPSPSPAPAPTSPKSQLDPAQRAALVRDAETHLSAGRAAEANDRSCAGQRTAAGQYLDAGILLRRAESADRAEAAFARAKQLGDAVDKAEREGKCAPRQAAVTPKPGAGTKTRDAPAETCKVAIEQLRRVAERESRMGSIGPKRTVPGGSKEFAMMKIELAARGCRDPQNPLTGSDCHRVNADLMDVIPDEKRRQLMDASGCSSL